MSKNTRSSEFRRVDVDQYLNEKYHEDEDEEDVAAAGGGGPNSAEVQALLAEGRTEEALLYVLGSASLTTRNQAIKFLRLVVLVALFVFSPTGNEFDRLFVSLVNLPGRELPKRLLTTLHGLSEFQVKLVIQQSLPEYSRRWSGVNLDELAISDTLRKNEIRKDSPGVFELFAEVVRSIDAAGSDSSSIIQSYPQNYPNQDLLNALPKFTFPFASSFHSSAVDLFTFVLTDIDGIFKYGFCRLAADAQHALCIVSYNPWFDTFYKLLNLIAEMSNHPEDNDIVLLLDAVFAVDALTLSEITIAAGRQTFRLHRPDPNRLPSIPDNRNLTEYYSAVDTFNMMVLFASMLSERRIIVTSRRLSRLTACLHGAETLMYPLHCCSVYTSKSGLCWIIDASKRQHLFIPVLPAHLLDYCSLLTLLDYCPICWKIWNKLSAPMPYLVGVHSSLLPEAKRRELDDAIILDADVNVITSEHDDLSTLPYLLLSPLKRTLKAHISSKSSDRCVLMGDTVPRAFLNAMIMLIGGYRNALKVDTVTNSVSFDDEAFIQSQPASMQPMLKTLLHLQAFEQFVSDRLTSLNSTGRIVDDVFEKELDRIRANNELDEKNAIAKKASKNRQFQKFGKKLKQEGSEMASKVMSRSVKTQKKDKLKPDDTPTSSGNSSQNTPLRPTQESSSSGWSLESDVSRKKVHKSPQETEQMATHRLYRVTPPEKHSTRKSGASFVLALDDSSLTSSWESSRLSDIELTLDRTSVGLFTDKDIKSLIKSLSLEDVIAEESVHDVKKAESTSSLSSDNKPRTSSTPVHSPLSPTNPSRLPSTATMEGDSDTGDHRTLSLSRSADAVWKGKLDDGDIFRSSSSSSKEDSPEPNSSASVASSPLVRSDGFRFRTMPSIRDRANTIALSDMVVRHDTYKEPGFHSSVSKAVSRRQSIKNLNVGVKRIVKRIETEHSFTGAGGNDKRPTLELLPEGGEIDIMGSADDKKSTTPNSVEARTQGVGPVDVNLKSGTVRSKAAHYAQLDEVAKSTTYKTAAERSRGSGTSAVSVGEFNRTLYHRQMGIVTPASKTNGVVPTRYIAHPLRGVKENSLGERSPGTQRHNSARISGDAPRSPSMQHSSVRHYSELPKSPMAASRSTKHSPEHSSNSHSCSSKILLKDPPDRSLRLNSPVFSVKKPADCLLETSVKSPLDKPNTLHIDMSTTNGSEILHNTPSGVTITSPDNLRSDLSESTHVSPTITSGFGSVAKNLSAAIRVPDDIQRNSVCKRSSPRREGSGGNILSLTIPLLDADIPNCTDSALSFSQNSQDLENLSIVKEVRTVHDLAEECFYAVDKNNSGCNTTGDCSKISATSDTSVPAAVTDEIPPTSVLKEEEDKGTTKKKNSNKGRRRERHHHDNVDPTDESDAAFIDRTSSVDVNPVSRCQLTADAANEYLDQRLQADQLYTTTGSDSSNNDLSKTSTVNYSRFVIPMEPVTTTPLAEQSVDFPMGLDSPRDVVSAVDGIIPGCEASIVDGLSAVHSISPQDGLSTDGVSPLDEISPGYGVIHPGKSRAIRRRSANDETMKIVKMEAVRRRRSDEDSHKSASARQKHQLSRSATVDEGRKQVEESSAMTVMPSYYSSTEV